ncbi:MAG: hypothetical protein VB110_09415 [Bacteroidales bacterium]|nr:hypothetical protein [Bacteroidales bacterium]
MGYYINDIVTFSNKGFEKIDFNFIESPENAEITDYNSKHLQGKGLRFVPRTVRMLHNVVGEILEKNGLNTEKDMMGIYNTNDICALEPSIDFDLEVENYGVKLANPMKIPYTLNGSTAGWLGIRSKMNNVNLSVNSGRCGILAAFNLTGLDFMDKETSHAIILCAHYMGEMYKKYNKDSTFNKEIAVGILASEKKTDTSIIEVLECRTMSYNKKKLEEIVDLQNGYTFIDTDFYINLQNHGQLQFFQSTSPQLSCLPFFINNMNLFLPENKGQEHQYIIIDKKGFMGYMKFKRSQP